MMTLAENGFYERLQRIDSELLWRRADIVVEGRWSLYQHLQATLDTLESWNQPPRVQIAGLLHTAYSHVEGGRPPLFSEAERSVLADLAGSDGELLIKRYSEIDRDDLLAAMRNDAELPADGSASLIVASPMLGVTTRDIGDLLVIHLATLAQKAAPDGLPVPWLATASELAIYVRIYAEIIPPVFANCTARLSAISESKLVDAYADLLLREYASHQEQASLLAALVKEFPWVAEPSIWLGLLSIAAGDCATSAVYGASAMRTITDWNTSWDKRLSPLQWLSLANFTQSVAGLTGRESDFLAHRVQSILVSATRPDAVYAQLMAVGALGEMRIAPENASPMAEESLTDDDDDWEDFKPLPSRFCEYLGGLRANTNRPLMNLYPGLTARPWWDPSEFDIVKELEQFAEAIMFEYESLDARRFRRAGKHLNRRGRWDEYVLYEQGAARSDNLEACPVTAQIVEKYADLLYPSGRVCFTRLSADGKTAQRNGADNFSLTCQLGLGKTFGYTLRVDDLPERLRPRRCLVFDSSFLHDEWNGGVNDSAALSLDIWHPDLRNDEISLVTGLHRMIEARSVPSAASSSAPGSDLS